MRTIQPTMLFDSDSGRDRREHFLVYGMSVSAFLIVGVVVWILLEVLLQGSHGLNPAFIFGGVEAGLFNPQSGVYPMLFGTVALVLIMTVCVMPLGVITAIYLHEYASHEALWARVVRLAVSNLAGVPSVVFGLFGLGFFVYFIGGSMDHALGNSTAVWGKPALIWASFTLAALTLPVVVVTTEESLRMVPHSVRDASIALGANKLQTLGRVILPQALPGILTGVILAISRAAGEVAPIMITGAALSAPLPKGPTDQFMELGYHIWVLTTQSPNIEATKPLLFATVLLLLLLTLSLNLLAIVGRAYLRRKYHHSIQ